MSDSFLLLATFLWGGAFSLALKALSGDIQRIPAKKCKICQDKPSQYLYKHGKDFFYRGMCHECAIREGLVY